MKLFTYWRLNSIFFLFLSVNFVQSCNPFSNNERAPVVYIAVAASTLDAMKTLARTFTLETGINIEIIHGSSGKLASQITQSAPYSLFFSADEYYPNFLIEKGYGASKPVIYAQGFLAVWVRDINNINTSLIDILVNKNIQKIAIANTTSAPYGKVTYEWMKEINILKEIEHKLVFGESIAQVNTYLMTNTVDLAFTALSSLQTVDEQIRTHLIALPIEEYKPIQQAMIITNYGQKVFPAESLSFFNFVRSNKGQDILKDYGYFCPKN